MRTREELTAYSRAYWQSRALLTAVELGIFETLGGRRLGAAAVARRIHADPRAVGMLLDALAGQGILAKRGSAYAIAGSMRPFLTEGPQSALGMLRHHLRLWDTWSTLTEAVRTGKAREEEGGFRGGPEAARAFTMAMRDGALRFAPGVADEVRLVGRKLLLDIGGGPGIYAAWFARRNPGLAVIVVDLPHVAKVGEELLAEHPDVRDRLSYHAADVETEPLPAGADAAFLSHVIHGQDEGRVRALFAKIARSLEPRGLLVVRDFFLSPDGTQPAQASLFTLNMLVNTPGGRSYTAREVMGWLRRAGFRTAAYRRSKVAPDAGYVLAKT
ncbi:MAG: methyltransferase [Planctomycetota bacterium]|jgi:SAM-dependent methyltransferase